MYAIVEIAGQQFKVEPGKKIFVHRLEEQEGNSIRFDNVLLLEEEGVITIGAPTVKDAVIEGRIIDHVRGEKVIVFKKKRKKGYRIKNGHRQNFTQVEILSLNGKGLPEETVTKKKKAAPAEPAAEKHPVNSKAAEQPSEEPKKAPAKKSTAKKASKE